MSRRTTSIVLTYLREWRARALLTQHDLAEAAGVAAWTIGRAENGQAVSLLTAARLARALGVSVKDLAAKEPE